MKRIISLSSVPPRFSFLGPTLKSLALQQDVDEVRLYIPETYHRFPEYTGNLPDVPDGVTICRIKEDLGPATKVLPAAQDFRGQDVQLLFCDDDLIYPKGWANKLFRAQAKRPHVAIATVGRIYATPSSVGKSKNQPRARHLQHHQDLIYRTAWLMHRLFGFRRPFWRPTIFPGYIDILFGVGGVVIRPNFFDDESMVIPEEVWAVDDVWLSAQLARKNIAIYSPWRFPCADSGEQSNYASLLGSEFGGKDRQQLNQSAIALCQEKYGVWTE